MLKSNIKLYNYLFLILLPISISAQNSLSYPFILNNYTSVEGDVNVNGSFSYNYLKVPFYALKDQNGVSNINNIDDFFTTALKVNYKKFGLEFGLYNINFSSELPDYKKFYLQMEYNIIKSSIVDFGISYLFVPKQAEENFMQFILTKNIDRVQLSLGLEPPVMYGIIPILSFNANPFFSISYCFKSRFDIFQEIKYVRSAGYGIIPSIFNIGGLRYKTTDFLNLSLYYIFYQSVEDVELEAAGGGDIKFGFRVHLFY